MTCTNCGSAFHEKWACTKPLKVAEEAISTASRMDGKRWDRNEPEAVATKTGSKIEVVGVVGSPRVASPESRFESDNQAGTQAPPVDTTPKRGRPKTITDMRTYKANKAKQYRALAKAKTTD